MESKRNVSALVHQAWVLALVMVTLTVGDGVAAMAGPCSGTLASLSACLAAVEGENPPAPSDACCAVVRSTDTACLCSVVTAYSNSMGVNLHAALLLPKECKKLVPSGFTCDGYMVPSFVPHNRKLTSV